MQVTYPGSATPLRGLAAFTEAERDVFFGRDREREDVAHMVTAEAFRSGLIHGEPGVGKTSFLRAGLLPHLRDHGVVAMYCEDLRSPADALAAALANAGHHPNAGEAAPAFLARVAGNALPGQQFIFVLDDVDAICTNERAITEVGELFQRVVSRSGGKARFLFSCASERVHLLSHLERRTGSLFPPQARFSLERMAPTDAAMVLDRTFSLGGVSADRALIDDVVRGLGRGGPVLPGELQIAALAINELGITSSPQLAAAGGAGELENAWLHRAAQSTGNQRGALRLLAELASGGTMPAEGAAARISIDPNFARHAFETLAARGLVRSSDDGTTVFFGLRHEMLAARLRELTAPARAAARRAYDLLGSKTKSKQRLSLLELYALWSEGIVPANPEEQAVVARSQAFYKAIAIGIAALPVVVIIFAYLLLGGRYFLDISSDRGSERVMVRKGRPSLSSFFWLPGGYGDIVADTGLSKAQVDPTSWHHIADRDLGGDLDSWSQILPTITEPVQHGLVEYASTGDKAAIGALRKAMTTPDAAVRILGRLSLVARGGVDEEDLVASALRDPAPAVKQAGIAMAAAAAGRRSNLYTDTLTRALTSPDPELRRAAFAACRGMPEKRRSALFAGALAKNPEIGVRRELLAEMSSTAAGEEAPPETAVSTLGDAESPEPLRAAARAQLRRTLHRDPGKVLTALSALISDEEAPADARIFAIGLILDDGPTELPIGVTEAARKAAASRTDNVRGAALPLLARGNASEAAPTLATLLGDRKANRALRVGMASAYGELARTKFEGAEAALVQLVADPVPDVRAAAASAYGYVGRAAQEKLVVMVRIERSDVAIGAARGLANSADNGGSAGVAIDGIYQLWKQKGRARREAARIYAQMAHKKLPAVVNMVGAAARNPEDQALHPIGVEGLCNAADAGSTEARRLLARLTEDPSAEVRRMVIRCVADGPEPAKHGVPVAVRLVRDPEPSIRSEAARVLAAASGDDKLPAPVGDALVNLISDSDRGVRVIALGAIAALKSAAPAKAGPSLVSAFGRADEGEKLALLRAGRAIAAADLVAPAATDPSPTVRIEAIDVAIASGNAADVLIAAVGDSDARVRRAALERLGTGAKVPEAVLERMLTVGIYDPDPDLATAALTTLARVGDKEVAKARLTEALTSPKEAVRARGAVACAGLVERDAELADKLLKPLLTDSARDVRAAVIPSLGAAWAKTHSVEALTKLLQGSETRAVRRLVATAAFLVYARTEAGRAAAETALTKVADHGDPLVKRSARLALGLITSEADGIRFLQELTP